MQTVNQKAFLFLLISIVLLFGINAIAEPNEIARLYSKQGSVEKLPAGSAKWKEIEINEPFYENDTVRAGKNSRAGLLFADGVYLRLSSIAEMQFHDKKNKKASQPVSMKWGLGHFFSRKPRSYPTIKTPTVSASIRGTEFVIDASKEKTVISVINGAVDCSNEHGSVSVGSGEQALAKAGAAPVKSIMVNPFDAVQWALHYPPVLDPGDHVDLSPETQKALAQAGSLLSSGQTVEAKALLEKTIKIADTLPQESADKLKASALSQKAIIALITNKNEEAAALADKAFTLSPESASALLALSYVKQSEFDLEEARELLETALSFKPDNAFLLARLAELELGFGNTEKAEELSLNALNKDPSLAYAQTILGFVELFKNDTSAALSAFDSSIKKDSTAALPHLGRGLTYIKEGDFGAGQIEIQKAAHLEPSTAIYRSYLGKAFFEDEEEDLAGEEFNVAVKLDPRDPTPYLYRGFNELSQNRPVSALKDVEKSIELNNNRAVYRSKLLLDQDLGTRSAGLAQVFNELGFSEVARIEAIKSLSKDYTNYSAHRLLADSQETVFTADAAFSERRIATLLSPLSFNMFNSTGGNASLNEYNALFDKSEERTAVTGTFHSVDDIYAVEATHAGKEGKFGYLMGLASEFSGGSRSNNFSRDYRLSLAGQYQFTHKDRLILEGDVQFLEREAWTGYRIIEEDELTGEESIFERGGYSRNTELTPFDLRLGYAHDFSASSHLIAQASVARGDNKMAAFLNRDVNVIEILSDEQLAYEDLIGMEEKQQVELVRYRTEAQYIYESPVLSAVGGFQVYYGDIDRDEDNPILDDSYNLFALIDRRFVSDGDNSLNASDVYLYTTYHAAAWADLSVGLTHSSIQTEQSPQPAFVDGVLSKARFNPKLGLTVYPLPNLSVRAAYFETLRKPSVEDQESLEPTIVGGINQRFNDLSGTESRNYGVGIDYKLPSKTYSGVEWTHRDGLTELAAVDSNYYIDFSQMTESSGGLFREAFDFHFDQDIAKAYVYQVITEQIVGALNYNYDLFEYTDPTEPLKLEAQRVAGTLRYFDPSGFFVYGKATWREQDLFGSDQSTIADGTENFWIFDAAVGYRFPKRHGSVSLQLLNLTDQNFNYYQSLGLEDFIAQDLTVRLVGSYNF